MTPLQNAYTSLDDSLGHLLVQIDTFYQDLPEAVRRAFDNLGTTTKWGCHCDLEDGQEPDACVLDDNRPQDCIYARSGGDKTECQHWKPVALKRSSQRRADQHD